MTFEHFIQEYHLFVDSAKTKTLYQCTQISPFFSQFCRNQASKVKQIDWDIIDSETSLAAQVDSLFSHKNLHESLLMQQLRILRKTIYAKLVFQQYSKLIDFENIAFILSLTAKLILHKLHDYLTMQLQLKHELSEPLEPLLILAMGKLGANELNYSSDIDLIFLYPSKKSLQCNNHTDIDNQRLYNEVGQKLISYLNQVTVDGFVYRVDMRLRPYGDASPLSLDLASFEQYLIKDARAWERYAYLKADVVTGGLNEINKVKNMLNNFVYRHYHDYKMIAEIRQMKAKVIKETHKKSLINHIKLGRGGIREVEFLCQCLQLVYGGQNKQLQTPALKTALYALAHAKHISFKEANEIYQHYVFLRNVENAIQMFDDQQTHQIPSSALAQHALTELLGIQSWSLFVSQLTAVRKSIQHYFDTLTQFNETFTSNTPTTKPQLALKNMLTELRTTSTHSLTSEQHHIINQMIDLAKQQHKPTFMGGINRLIHILSKRKNYLYLLADESHKLPNFIKTLSLGKRVLEEVIQYPFLIEYILSHNDSNYQNQEINIDQIRLRLHEKLNMIEISDTENYLETLRKFKIEFTFTITLAQSNKQVSLMESGDLFSMLANIIIESVIEGAWHEVLKKSTLTPSAINTYKNALSIIAYGKLGGVELSLSSDLDIVFLCDNNDQLNRKLFVRVIQKFIHFMQVPTYYGKLYEIDLRLRPNGSDGFLISSMEAFLNYQQHHAWTWEHQAITRARCVHGSKALKSEFAHIRQQIICIPKEPLKLKKSITDMRYKMRQNRHIPQGEFDLKHSVGAMIDIEFLAQYFALAYSHKHPAICFFTDSIRIIQTVESINLITLDTAESLIDAYCYYRHLCFQCYVDSKPELINQSIALPYADQIMKIWDHYLN